MTTTLPPEILLHIARFIPSEDLVRLYGVNRMFMKLAFEEKYGKATIGSQFWCPVEGERYVKRLKRLSKPHPSRQVRALTIRSDFSLSQTRENFATRTWSAFKYVYLPLLCGPFALPVRVILGSGQWRYNNFTRHAIRLIEALSTQKQITQLSLIFPFKALRCEPGSRQLLDLLTPSITSGIRELRLEGLSQLILEAISKELVFDHLECLRLEITDSNKSEVMYGSPLDARDAGPKLAQFINSHSGTLKTLEITLPSQYKLDPELIFSHLSSEFPLLESLSVNTRPYLPSRLSPSLFHFISRHSTQLRRLTIPAPEDDIHQSGHEPLVPPSHSPFPTKLRHLEISSPAMIKVNTNLVRKFIQASARTLTSLNVHWCPGFDDIREGARDLSIQGLVLPNLRHLRLRTRLLTPEGLAGILDDFPCITSLEVVAHLPSKRNVMCDWSSEDEVRMAAVDVNDFVGLMQATPVKKCSVTSLDIWVEDFTRDFDGEGLKKCLPSLERATFRGGHVESL